MDELTLLRISLQRALLGEVTQNLVGITAGITGSKILIRAYFSEGATVSETDRISCIGAEVIADFPEFYEIDEQVMFPTQEKMAELDFWAFLRAKS